MMRPFLLGVGLSAMLLTLVGACGAFGAADGQAQLGGDAGQAASDATTGSDGATVAVLDPCADGGAHRFMFVTHQTFRGDIAVDGGAPGAVADRICNAAAAAAGLPGTYIAWLSTSTEHPTASIEPGVPILLPRACEVVADGFVGVTTTLKTAPNSTEFGETLGYPCRVWSNTTANGISASGPGFGEASCSEWTSADPAVLGVVGNCTSLDFQWAAWEQLACNSNSAHLYCLQN
jgi:hypothetical protein